MKKKLLLLVFIFLVTGCIRSSDVMTSVRINDLQYVLNSSTNSLNTVANNTIDNNDEELILIGDELIFTIILEDPNYEFVSLLYILFNNVVIRANTTDTIVITRDCGDNICIDFPYKVEENISIYSVDEVKFTQFDINESVNAIIDTSSKNYIELDIYTNDIFPYVVESVELINELFNNMKFYNVDDLNSSEDLYNESFFYRMLSIEGLEDSPTNLTSSTEFDVFYIPGVGGPLQGVYFEECGFDCDGKTSTKPHVKFFLFDKKYEGTYVKNNGNKLYINVLGEDYFIFEMGKRTRFIPLDCTI